MNGSKLNTGTIKNTLNVKNAGRKTGRKLFYNVLQLYSVAEFENENFN